MTMNGWLEPLITVPTGGWVIDCDDGGGGGGGGAYQIAFSAGEKYTFSADDSSGVSSPFVPGLVAEFNRLNVAAGKGISAAIGTDGYVTISSTAGTPAITWDSDSAEFEELIGFAANVTTNNQKGTQCPTGVWVPDCALSAYNGNYGTIDAFRGAMEIQAQTSRAPTGSTRTLMYQRRYARDFQWTMVSKRYVWIKDESAVNESFERFCRNVVYREQAWASSVVAWNYDKTVGHAGGLLWTVTQRPEKQDVRPGWTDRFRARLGRCVLMPEFTEQGIW